MIEISEGGLLGWPLQHRASALSCAPLAAGRVKKRKTHMKAQICCPFESSLWCYTLISPIKQTSVLQGWLLAGSHAGQVVWLTPAGQSTSKTSS